MTDSKVQTIQGVCDAFGRGDVEWILEQVTDDVDWASCPEDTIAPWHGTYRGKAEVPNFFKELGTAADVTEFTLLSLASNETDVMGVIRFGMTIHATGKSDAMDLHHWWRFRDGRICFYRGTEDTAATAEIMSS